MNSFAYSRPATIAEAVNAGGGTGAKFLGGGTNLVDLMKMGVEHPAHLVDITRLPMDRIEEHANGVRIGALARNSAVAAHPLIVAKYPVLSQAILNGASAQIRNMATTGGNLLQRTRCYYFYDPTYAACNKRAPGSGCAAIQGYNRIHAVLGVSDHCIAAYPGDMAVALMALNATVVMQGSGGERAVPIESFYKLPGNTPHIENDLRPGEIITAVDLPPAWGTGSYYLKIRDRNSYAFALVSVAAVADVGTDNRIRQARLALGGAGTVPWHVQRADDSLRGKLASDAVFRDAANILLQDAKPHRYNAFKVELARRAVIRALTTATARA